MNSNCVGLIIILSIFKSDSETPINLTATYKSPTTVQLKWTLLVSPLVDTRYFVFFQSGGVAHNVSFSLTRDQRSYVIMDLPLEPITNIHMVALTKPTQVLTQLYAYLPSTTGTSISSSMLNIFWSAVSGNINCSCSRVSRGGGVRRRIRSDWDLIHTDMQSQSTQWSGARLS